MGADAHSVWVLEDPLLTALGDRALDGLASGSSPKKEVLLMPWQLRIRQLTAMVHPGALL